jgi:uncharacterized damage-inducible protein DinB
MRKAPPLSGSERETLDAFLDFHRETLLQKCADLSPDQLATRSVAPSTLSLHGLIRHMAGVERWWFRQHICGMQLPMLNHTKQNPDLDFDGTDPARWPDDLETYQAEVAAARDAVADLNLDFVATDRHGNSVSLRWVYLHMIAEYARHNGHADLLRESVDGVTGW